MNQFRLSGLAALLALAGAGTSSCLTPPDYPVEPTISFNNVKLNRILPTNGNTIEQDELVFTLDFQDGDGDLGLDPNDLLVPPFTIKTGGHNNTGFHKNIFIQVFKKVNGGSGGFIKYVTPLQPQGSQDTTFPRLDGSIDGKPAPLRGSMTYKLPPLLLNSGVGYNTGDEVRYEISILDRAMHVSNVITTSSVVLGK